MTTNNWRDEFREKFTWKGHGSDGNGVLNEQQLGILESFISRIREEAKEEARKEIKQWANKNYRRYAEPLYAYVDAKELIDFLSPTSDTK